MKTSENCAVLNKWLCLHILVRDPKQNRLVQESELISVLKSASDKVTRFLPLWPVDILFALSEDVIPETGDWGYIENKSVIRLRANPAHKDGLKSIVKNQLPKTLAHELHHAVRMAKIGYGKTLLGAMVTEGLADRFADKLYPKPKSPWTNALNQEEQEKWWKITKKSLNKKYNHGEWFWGEGKIPRWAGYTLGYRLAGEAMDALRQPADVLVGAKARKILEASGWN